MNTRRPKRSLLRRGPGRALLRFHRRVGIALSIAILAVCVTGLLLNHQDDFALERRPVESPWIYRWYGMQPKGEIANYPVDAASILSYLDGNLYWNGAHLAPSEPLVAVADLPPLIAASTASEIILLSRDGAIVERLGPEAAPPGTIRSIGAIDRSSLYVSTDQGRFLSSDQGLTWRPDEAPPTARSVEAAAPDPQLRAQLLASHRGEGLTWGRIILDLHTGRFFGSLGKWIVDLTALGLIFLTITGLIYTFTFLRKARERSENSPETDEITS